LLKLVYAFDAYCGWSYGFAPTLAELVRRRPGLVVEVISGGLFTGQRRVPIREFGYVQGANAKISELTGVEFGPGYARLIADGSFVMDSEAAARGVAALRQAAPDRVVELTAAQQHAFYVDGQSLSDPATYHAIAEAAGLDPDTVVAAFTGPASAAAAEADFARAAGLGVHSYPTLLAVEGDRATALAVGHATVNEIDRRLDALTAAKS
jgi:putative protein-disulfide isomerase